MDREHMENLARLEKVKDDMWRVVDLCNKAGYKLSPQEFHELNIIKTLAKSAMDLGNI